MAEDQEKQIKSKELVRTRGEVFTDAREVNAMLDLVVVPGPLRAVPRVTVQNKSNL